MAKRLRDVCKLREDEALWRAGRGFVVRDLPWTLEKLRQIPPFEFENWAFNPSTSLAMQLSTIPEPETVVLVLLGVALFWPSRLGRRCRGMLSKWNIVVAVLAVLCAAGPSQADPYDFDDLPRGGGGIVVEQPPAQLGGPASDTAYYYPYPPFESWQLEADNVLLSQAATIRRVSWWGFYGGWEQNHDPPTGPETMRVRFYGARPGDGLPDDDNILYEESFLNPSRVATGEIILVGGLPDEYRYEVDLETPVELEPETIYWLEIAQLGDIDSLWRWEYGFGEQDDRVFINPSFPDWQSETGSFAFQLSTIPEPTSAGLFLCTLFMLGGRTTAGRRCRG